MAYNYYIEWSSTGYYYHGIQTKEGCCPDDFLNTYFTSSRTVWALIERDGLPDIVRIDEHCDPKVVTQREGRLISRDCRKPLCVNRKKLSDFGDLVGAPSQNTFDSYTMKSAKCHVAIEDIEKEIKAVKKDRTIGGVIKQSKIDELKARLDKQKIKKDRFDKYVPTGSDILLAICTERYHQRQNAR